MDSLTLYLIAAMVAALLGCMLMSFGRQENSPALKWWGTAYLLGAAWWRYGRSQPTPWARCSCLR